MDNSIIDSENIRFLCESFVKYKDSKVLNKKYRQIFTISSVLCFLWSAIFFILYSFKKDMFFLSIAIFVFCFAFILSMLFVIMHVITKSNWIKLYGVTGVKQKNTFYDNGILCETHTAQASYKYIMIKMCKITNEAIFMLTTNKILLVVKRENMLGAEYYDLVQFLSNILRQNGAKVIWDKHFNMPGA